MNHYMVFECSLLYIRLVTMVACKKSFIRVGTQMGFQIGFVGSFVVTLRALVWLDALVDCLNMPI